MYHPYPMLRSTNIHIPDMTVENITKRSALKIQDMIEFADETLK